MLLIPIHMLLDDKPSKLPGFLNKNYVGVSRKTIKNIINAKHAPSKNSIEKICLSLSDVFYKIPGCDINTLQLKEMLSNPVVIKEKLGFDFIIDEYTQYFRRIFGEIIKLDRCLRSDIEKIKQKQQDRYLKSFFGLMADYSFPANMLSDNLVKENDFSLSNAIRTLNRIRVDIVFYLLSAYEVEYNYHFYKKVNGNKPLSVRYLPLFEERDIKMPITIWFDWLITTHRYKSINEFAKSIPQLTVNPQKSNEQSKIRMVRKWRSGKTFPAWENINCITESIAKKYFTDDDTIEYLKEQGRFIYAYIKIFQKLLNMMLVNSQEQFGLNAMGVVDFFERYLYWHNYHSIYFKGQINQSQHGMA